MKRKSNIVILLVILTFIGFTSCSQEFDEVTIDTNNSGELKGLRASLKDFENVYEAGIRTAVSIDGLGNYQLVWSESDTLGIFPDQGFQVAFPMAEGAGGKSAQFNGGGWGLKSTSTYSAYCPLIGQFYLDKTKLPIKLTGQVQNANNSTDHLSSYDYMCSINSTVDNNGSVNFEFNHLVFFLHLRLTLPKAGIYKSILLETDGSLTTEATLNLSNGNLKSKQTSEVFSLKLNDIELTSDNLVLDAFMALLPVDLTNKTFKAKVFDSDNNCYEATLKSRNYEAGSFYHQARETTLAKCTSLPIVMINTPSWENVTSKDVWIDKTSISILDTNGTFFEASGKIKGRGNATWDYEKKPYAIKFSKKQSPFGFPENKSWILLADYNDRSLLRTAYMCAVSKAVGMEYTINYKHVNLYLNGEYKGIYLLTDKVENSNNRIQIEDDGFIIEDDNYYKKEPLYFVTNLLNRGFSFKYPDADDGEIVINDDNYNYITTYMDNLEESLIKLEQNPDNTEFLNFIDLSSNAKYYVAAQVIATLDPNNYYVLPSKTSKLKRLPMWDPEWSLGLWPTKAWGDAPSSMTTSNYWSTKGYFKYLVLSPIFKAEVKKEWQLFMNNITQVTEEINAVSALISQAQEYNFNKWPNTIPLNVRFDSWQEEVEYTNGFYEDRIEWLNNYIQSW